MGFVITALVSLILVVGNMVDRAVKRQSVSVTGVRSQGDQPAANQNSQSDKKPRAVNQYLFGRQLGPPDTPPDREFWAAGPRQGQNQYLFWAN